MKVNEAYEWYRDNPTVENREVLGDSLLRYMRAIMAHRFGNRYNLLKDATGEALCSVLEHLNTFDPTKNNFAMWVYAITYNKAIDALRSSGRQKEWPLLDNDGAGYNQGMEEQMIFRSFVDKLKPDHQALIKLLIAGHSYQEISDKLKIPIGTIWSRCSAIKRKLRTLGGGECLSSS